MSCLKACTGIFTGILLISGIYFLLVAFILLFDENERQFAEILLSSRSVPRELMDQAYRFGFWKVNVFMVASIAGGLLIFCVFAFASLCVDLFGFYVTVAVMLSLVCGTSISAGVLGVILHADIANNIENVLYYQLNNTYEDEGSEQLYSKAWNTVQVQMECCGVHTYMDYRNTTFPDRHARFVPTTCCKMEDKKQKTIRNETFCLQDASNGVSSSEYLNTRGCHGEYWKWASVVNAVQWGAAYCVTGLLMITIGLVAGLSCQVKKTPTSRKVSTAPEPQQGLSPDFMPETTSSYGGPPPYGEKDHYIAMKGITPLDKS